MANITNKLMELLRNIKSDAVPKPPRAEPAEPDSTTNSTDEPVTHGDSPKTHKKQTNEDDDHEEIIFGEEDFVKEKKTKPKFPFKSKKNKGDSPKEHKGSKNDKNGMYSSVNTQATGTVYNVVNSKNVQFGSNNVYYMSATSKNVKKGYDAGEDGEDEDENYVPKDNFIVLLMESEIEPTFKYMDFISKNLGINWKAFYTSLGYLKGYIDTLVLENGIIEARYKLLDDWVRNDNDGSLGRLATLLWEAGERQIVRELSLIYKENKKQ
ncbi:unnamed protein product [Diatraea saccharalis]|nr:unnamed protein product [Diatraea saccharalis]